MNKATEVDTSICIHIASTFDYPFAFSAGANLRELEPVRCYEIYFRPSLKGDK